MNVEIMSFAIVAHNNVNHLYDKKPYVLHLSMVVMLAMKHFEASGIPDSEREKIISACWLHDTIEDCRLTYNDIKKVAGEEVADIVYALTNEKGKNRSERSNHKYYEGIRSTKWASYVKQCDRLANIIYSHHTDSKMLDVYKKEHESFVNAIGVYPSIFNDMNGIFLKLK
jgi:(p)ppGpp synthase/HD superfamily hydrolase